MMSIPTQVAYASTPAIAVTITVGLTTGNWLMGGLVGIGSIILTFFSLWVGSVLENRRFSSESEAFREHSTLNGWDIEDRFWSGIKYEVRDYLINHPGVRTEELFTKFGDPDVAPLSEPRFVDTMTHLGAYSIYRFGVTDDGIWFAYGVNREVDKKHLSYVKQMVNLYNFKSPKTLTVPQ